MIFIVWWGPKPYSNSNAPILAGLGPKFLEISCMLQGPKELQHPTVIIRSLTMKPEYF